MSAKKQNLNTSHPSLFATGFAHFATATAWMSGQPVTFIIAVLMIVVWGVTGPIFHYSDTWQLVINTGTTIVTFLMVFLIQNSQNRDSAAIQVKLDEIIRNSNVRNSFVGIEHLTDEEIEELREKCEQRAKDARDDEPSQDVTGLHEASRNARRAADKASV
jgi:low affinity Fe/Cu permease